VQKTAPLNFCTPPEQAGGVRKLSRAVFRRQFLTQNTKKGGDPEEIRIRGSAVADVVSPYCFLLFFINPKEKKGVKRSCRKNW